MHVIPGGFLPIPWHCAHVTHHVAGFTSGSPHSSVPVCPWYMWWVATGCVQWIRYSLVTCVVSWVASTLIDVALSALYLGVPPFSIDFHALQFNGHHVHALCMCLCVYIYLWQGLLLTGQSPLRFGCFVLYCINLQTTCLQRDNTLRQRVLFPYLII